MAAKKNSSAMEFIVAALKSNPSVSYKEVAAAAAESKLTVFPIMYGRAQKMLGLAKGAVAGKSGAAKAPKAPKGPKVPKAKAAKAKGSKAKGSKAGRPKSTAPVAVAEAAPVKRGRGRPRKNPLPVTVSKASVKAGSLEGIVAAVKSADQARARYMAAIEKIQAILADALS
jgi:hypothetical protein